LFYPSILIPLDIKPCVRDIFQTKYLPSQIFSNHVKLSVKVP